MVNIFNAYWKYKTLSKSYKRLEGYLDSMREAKNRYHMGYNECRNILNPDQLKKIEKTLKELGIL